MRLQARLLLVFCVSLAATASAQLTLPHALGSHMVLQRDAPIHIWGWTTPGEAVTVTFSKSQAQTTSDTLGRFDAWLAPMRAGGPYELRIHAGDVPEVVLTDILIGDLWLASGQSNMEMPLAGFPNSAVVKDGEKEIAAANHPNIRLLLVNKTAAEYPQNDVDATWQVCTPESARDFSAVAYFFGRELSERENVPIGLIDSTWGGTPAEAWTSMEALAADPALAPVFQTWSRFSANQQNLNALIDAEKAEDAAALAKGMPAPRHLWHPNPASWRPAALYNGMIEPLTPLTIRGVIWYQGETNSALDRVPVYQRLFTTLINDWRTRFHQGAFPFLFAQISSYTSTEKEAWGALRDAQRRTLATAGTGMAVTLDIGDPGNVHPSDKQTVGHRLALAARAISYGERIEYAGPEPLIAAPEANCLRLWLRSSGLRCTGSCRAFEVAGADHVFHPAQARIDADSVVLTSPDVPEPRYARYAWSNATDGNLTSGSGLPAGTFTTEDTLASYSLAPTAVSALAPLAQ